MAVQDILNNSLFGQQYILGDDTYNDQQTNALGQSTGPTPTQNGLPAVDPDNDLRTPLQQKQDRIQANFDTLPAQDTEGKTIGSDGYVFQTAPDTRKSQLQTGLIAFGMSMLAGESDGQALMRAGQATAAHDAMIKRQSLIPSLVKKGYASVDIQKYVESGNPGDLTVNKGRTVPMGDGIHTVNTLTGEIQTVGTPQQKITYQDLGDRVIGVNPQGQQVASYDKGETPDEQSKNDLKVMNSGDETQVFNAMPKSKGGSNPQLTALTKKYQQPVAAFNDANQVINEMDEAKGGTPQERNQATIAAGDRLVRTLLGGNATLSPESIREMTGSPVKMDQWQNYLAVQSGRGNPDQALEFIKGIATAARNGYRSRIRSMVTSDRDNMKRYNDGDPHKTTGDIMTVAGISPDMFMNDKEQDIYAQNGTWTKTGGLTSHSAPVATQQSNQLSDQDLLNKYLPH
ncbi:hypothetical protein [Klebsiella variicola]|uniref:hypothetical protein n=1 Tax=Klebsiella variicola TaxID=244366 RepID=UPI002406BD1D|nr:hypothetical protein [Klebsiella variicola]MDG0490085.1 hypothetical protein [Klebsiella variicola]